MALFGTPGPLTDWAARTVDALLAAPGLKGVTLDDDASTERFLEETQEEASYIVSHFPRPELLDWLEAHAIPVALVLDDPLDLLAWQVAHSRLDAATAARVASQSLSLIASAAHLGPVALQANPECATTANEFASLLARDLSVLAAETIEENLRGRHVAADLPAHEAIAGDAVSAKLKAAARKLTDDMRREMRDICDPLLATIAGEPRPTFTWETRFFFDGTTYVCPAPSAIDLLGPARCLYYGPYLHLPVGVYRAVLNLVLSQETIETHLRAEVFTSEPVASFVTVARQGGEFRFPLEVEVTDSRQPIQIRMFLDRGEIDGRLGFAGAKLQLRGETA